MPTNNKNTESKNSDAVVTVKPHGNVAPLAYLNEDYRVTTPLAGKTERFFLTSGRRPGNIGGGHHGGSRTGWKTIGPDNRVPLEAFPDSLLPTELNFEFHYFFMRKYWFAYLSKAL